MEQQTIQEEEKQQQEPQKSSFLSDVAEILETVFVSIFVVILLFAYVVRPVTVDGDSMRETLHDKDRLLMSDLLYTPEYGDIVIVNNTHSYLYDEDGNLVEGWTSGKVPHTVRGLELEKEYTLTEKRAPDGYAEAESIVFKLVQEGTEQVNEVYSLFCKKYRKVNQI